MDDGGIKIKYTADGFTTCYSWLLEDYLTNEYDEHGVVFCSVWLFFSGDEPATRKKYVGVLGSHGPFVELYT
jgi:hypothetical protein